MFFDDKITPPVSKAQVMRLWLVLGEGLLSGGPISPYSSGSELASVGIYRLAMDTYNLMQLLT